MKSSQKIYKNLKFYWPLPHPHVNGMGAQKNASQKSYSNI